MALSMSNQFYEIVNFNKMIRDWSYYFDTTELESSRIRVKEEVTVW